MKEKRADFVAGWLGGRVIAAGGLGQHIYSSTWLPQVESCIYLSWEALACASALTCCFRGAGNEPAPLASAESYNPAKQRWECVAPMPTARCSSALLQTSSMLFVIGGVAQGPSNAVEALCLSDTA